MNWMESLFGALMMFSAAAGVAGFGIYGYALFSQTAVRMVVFYCFAPFFGLMIVGLTWLGAKLLIECLHEIHATWLRRKL